MSVSPRSEPTHLEVSPDSGKVLAGLCSRILSQIADYVFAGEATEELRVDFEQARARIEENISTENAQIAEQAVGAALSSRTAREKDASQRIAMETQQMVGVLNDALMALSGGSQRSVSRLQRIQESLQRTSRIRDAEGLRASLADAMTLIREESHREQEQADRDLAAFESQVVKVRQQLVENPARRLRGRADAIRTVSDALLTLKPGDALYAVAFSPANVQALVHRYGPESVDELFFQVIRDRVQPLAAAHTSWRWSPACIVASLEGPADIQVLQAKLTELSRAPFVYRMTLGNRTAVLKVGLSHMVIALKPESFSQLIGEIDRFGGIEVSNG